MKLPKSLNKKDLSFLGFIVGYIFLGVGIYFYFGNRQEIVVQPVQNPPLVEKPSQDFSFLVFGDSGVGSSEQKQLAENMKQENAEMIIHTGDLAYNSGKYEEIQRNVIDIYGDLLTTKGFYPSLGNHDYGTDDGQPFVQTFSLPGNERYYSFEHNDVLFVALDTNQPLSETPNQMLPWLEETLSANQSKWTVVYFHHPPYSSGLHGSEKKAQEKLVPILDKYQVDFVFSGHDHNYQRSCYIKAGSCQSAGTLYIVSGGGGAPLYPVGPRQWFTAQQISAHHFLLATKNDCTIVFEVIGLEQQRLDQFSKSKC